MRGLAVALLVSMLPASALAADPVGALEVVDCLGARGWAQDPDQPTVSIDVHVYFNAPPGGAGAAAIAVHADQQRDDLCTMLGTCTHGFSLELPLGIRDGASHPVWAYGIDLEGVNNPAVGGPIEVVCPAPPLVDGVRRWVTAPEVLTAWGFDSFVDLAHVADTSLQNIAQATDWPAAPQLVSADATTMWILDGTQRRAIDAAAMTAWGFDPATAMVMTAAQLDAMPQGPDWRPRPFLVQGTGPEVFAVDAVPCTMPACDDGDDTGEGTSDDGAADSDGGNDESSSGEAPSGESTSGGDDDSGGSAGDTTSISGAAPERNTDADGCGCTSGRDGTRALPWLLVAVALRRRGKTGPR